MAVLSFEKRDGKVVWEDLVSLEELVRTAEKPKDLARIWRRAKPGFVRELTVQQRSQIKQFITACDGVQPAAQAMLGAIRSWGPFAARCAADDGLFKAPTRPHIGFLLKHVEVAMNLLHGERSEDLQVPAVASPRRRVTRTQKKMTEEETAAYLAAITEEDD